MKKYLGLFSLLLVLTALPAFSQTSDEQLAKYYLESGDYEKALLYYENLYDKNQNSANYNGLYSCYMQLESYKDAEKLVKKHMKKYRSNTYYIDLGAVYEAQGDKDDAEDAYREAIENLPKSQGMIIRTANEFIKRSLPELALDTYEAGKKILDNSYPFSYEMAGLYGSMGNTEKMILAYLDLLEYNESYLQTIQNALNRSIDFETDEDSIELLRVELLRRVQKSPEKTIYAELLTWLFLQQRDFNSAFIQLKAIDKRLGENGQRLLSLANLCLNNKEFRVAAKCYEYLVEKGEENPYYVYARAGELKASFEDLRRAFPPDTSALEKLDEKYASLLAELGKNRETIGVLRQKAQLEAYYLGRLKDANVTLNDALDVRGIPEEMRGEIKLDLARILIARDYIWDASILCSQVDKAFKNDVLGYEAKFLNAKISYYNGEFNWAQAQLDILKGSTSKLISNDAIELSLLITDNLNLDTIYEPMLMFSRADLYTTQRRFESATTTLDSIVSEYPGHALADDILLKRARICESKLDLECAISYYEELLADHYFGINADNALFRMAELYQEKLNNPDKAQELYKDLITDFPGSLFVVEARKRFRALRGDEVNSEMRQINPEKIP
ncbi:MAG: tetratricopeptide repeat protein [Cryomorphaceae bacterium]|nr:tetratricopeptide repeat protein [Flavobacteriales bacterium]